MAKEAAGRPANADEAAKQINASLMELTALTTLTPAEPA
jgi:hypothetical protein